MNTQKNPYHIDVTEEEDSLFREQETVPSNANAAQSFTFKKALVVVFMIHAVGLLAVFGLPTAQKSQSTSSGSMTDNTTITSNATETSQNNLTKNSVPVDQAPLVEDSLTKQPTQAASVVVPPKTNPTKSSPLYTKEYTVKQGDTIYHIAKKYKLNTNKLLELNGIKDPSKIVVGQKLKFL
jgi:LysM repeat protein